MSNVIPATGLKIVGTGACLPYVASLLFKQVEDVWASMLWVSGALLLEFGPILAWYRFQAAEEFVVIFAIFFV